MFNCKCFSVAICLIALAFSGGLVGAFGQTTSTEKAVAKLIAQLGAADFQTRAQASKELEKLGSSVLAALRKAPTERLEVKYRIERVITRNENSLLQDEEKRWIGLGPMRRGIKTRLLLVLGKTPGLSDQQVVSAIYLLTVARYPTDAERTKAQKLLQESRSRPALQLARCLVQSREFNRHVAAANKRILKAKEDNLMPESRFGNAVFFNDEFPKMAKEVAASLRTAARGDPQFIDLAFLVVLSRFPKKDETARCLDHFNNNTNRAVPTAEIVWATTNSKEFLVGP